MIGVNRATSQTTDQRVDTALVDIEGLGHGLDHSRELSLENQILRNRRRTLSLSSAVIMMQKHVFRCMETDCSRKFGVLHRKQTCIGCGWIFCKSHVFTKSILCGSCFKRKKEPPSASSSLQNPSLHALKHPTLAPNTPKGSRSDRLPAEQNFSQASNGVSWLQALLPLLLVSGLLSALTAAFIPLERSAAVAALSILMSVWTSYHGHGNPASSPEHDIEKELHSKFGDRLISPKFRQAIEKQLVESEKVSPESAIHAARKAVSAKDDEYSPAVDLERLQNSECSPDIPLRQLRTSSKDLDSWIKTKMGQIDFLHGDDKLFIAWGELQSVLAALAHLQLPETPRAVRSHAVALWEEAVASERFRVLRMKVKQSNSFLAQLAQNDGWQLIRESTAGTKTLFRKELDNDLYSFKVSGTVTGDLVRIIAVLYETDLYPEWFPFMKHSVELGRPSRFRKQFLLQLWFPWPFQNRDLLLDGYGVDMMEQSQAIINVSSIPPEHHLHKGNPCGKGYSKSSARPHVMFCGIVSVLIYVISGIRFAICDQQ